MRYLAVFGLAILLVGLYLPPIILGSFATNRKCTDNFKVTPEIWLFTHCGIFLTICILTWILVEAISDGAEKCDIYSVEVAILVFLIGLFSW